jgi:hypothetical protein
MPIIVGIAENHKLLVYGVCKAFPTSQQKANFNKFSTIGTGKKE